MAGFTAEVQLNGKTATGIEVPPEVIDDLDAGKRPTVAVTINGFTFSVTLGVMGGKTWIPVSAERRTGAGIAAGETVDITMVVDDAPKVIEVPDDLAAALDQAGVRAAFDALAPSHRKEHVRAVTDAKKPETRARRIATCVEMLTA
ncbi:MAG: YdeI/OmpD-associated family protein [Aquihabitans sp.]